MEDNKVENIYVPFVCYEFTDPPSSTLDYHPLQTNSPQTITNKDLEFNHKNPEDFSGQDISNRKKKRKRERSPKPSEQFLDGKGSQGSDDLLGSSLPSQPFMTQPHDDTNDESTTSITNGSRSANDSEKKREKDIRYQKKQKALQDKMAELIGLSGRSKAEIMKRACEEIMFLRNENKKFKSLMGKEVILKKEELEQKNAILKSENDEQKQKIEELKCIINTETGIIGTMFDKWTDLI